MIDTNISGDWPNPRVKTLKTTGECADHLCTTGLSDIGKNEPMNN